MIIIVQGRYTTEALAGMMAAPEDRAKEAKRLIEAAGGKFIVSYFTLGPFDFLVVAEFDKLSAATPTLIAAAAGGSLASMQTTVGMSWDDARDAFGASGKLAKSFRSAGKRGKK
jgi:uncharacterized protein with GYD domain